MCGGIASLSRGVSHWVLCLYCNSGRWMSALKIQGSDGKGGKRWNVMSFLKRKIIKWAWHSSIDLEGFRIPRPILSGSTNNFSLSSAAKISRQPEEEAEFCCLLGIATQVSCRKLGLGRSDPELMPRPSCAPWASLLHVHVAPCAPLPSAFSTAVLTRDEGWNQDVSLGLVSCSGAQTPSPAVLLGHFNTLCLSFPVYKLEWFLATL